MRRVLILSALSALLLAACSDEPEPVAAPAAGPSRVTVAQVTAVEVGVSPGGVVIAAQGVGAGEGWTEARLLPRGLAADGAFEFDMTALPPAAPDPALTQRLRADLPVRRADIANAGRVRVIGARGAVEAAVPPLPAPQAGG
jgi:hypothetical protein